MCLCVCMEFGGVTCLCINGGQEVSVRCLPLLLLPCFWRLCLSVNLSLTVLADWLASEPLESALLHPLSLVLGFQIHAAMPSF